MEVKTVSRKKKRGPLKKLGRGLYKIVDAIIVTPISALVYRINKIIKKNTGMLEGLFNKPHSLLIFSLIIAVFAFLVVDHKANNLVETESEMLSQQPVTVIYNKEKYVVEGIPENVDIILMGRKSDLYLAKQLGEHKVVLDLSDYKTGEYNVKLKYNHSVESVTYRLIPSSVTVKISEKVSSVKTLTYDLLNQDKLDSKLNVSEVKLKESEVYVKGSSETLARVATVKALIDVSTLNLTTSGTFEIDSLPMVAYDENGKLVDNVEIVPSTAAASIKVDSYYVDLPVEVVPNGTFATGYAISSATSSVSSVRVYGDQAILSKLTSITAEIDVEGLNSDKKFVSTLVKPSGVRYMSESTTTIEVKVGTEETIEVAGVAIDIHNLSSNYAASAVSDEETSCTVILKGVGDVINKIDASSINAYVDLSGYEPGTYDVPVVIERGNLTVTYTPKIKTVKIKIFNKG